MRVDPVRPVLGLNAFALDQLVGRKSWLQDSPIQHVDRAVVHLP